MNLESRRENNSFSTSVGRLAQADLFVGAVTIVRRVSPLEVSTRLVEVRKVGYSGLDLRMLSSSHFDRGIIDLVTILIHFK